MSYEHNTPEHDPWDVGVYRNGSTKPPKNRGGIIAVLLIAVIMLCGIVTVLSFLNIRLFKQMGKNTNDGTLPIVFSEPDQTTPELTGNTVPMEAVSETKKNRPFRNLSSVPGKYPPGGRYEPPGHL